MFYVGKLRIEYSICLSSKDRYILANYINSTFSNIWLWYVSRSIYWNQTVYFASQYTLDHGQATVNVAFGIARQHANTHTHKLFALRSWFTFNASPLVSILNRNLFERIITFKRILRWKFEQISKERASVFVITCKNWLGPLILDTYFNM